MDIFTKLADLQLKRRAIDARYDKGELSFEEYIEYCDDVNKEIDALKP